MLFAFKKISVAFFDHIIFLKIINRNSYRSLYIIAIAFAEISQSHIKFLLTMNDLIVAIL